MGSNRPPFYPQTQAQLTKLQTHQRLHPYGHRCSSSHSSHIKIALGRNKALLFPNSARQRPIFPSLSYRLLMMVACSWWWMIRIHIISIVKIHCFLRSWIITVCLGVSQPLRMLQFMRCPLQLLSTHLLPPGSSPENLGLWMLKIFSQACPFQAIISNTLYRMTSYVYFRPAFNMYVCVMFLYVAIYLQTRFDPCRMYLKDRQQTSLIFLAGHISSNGMPSLRGRIGEDHDAMPLACLYLFAQCSIKRRGVGSLPTRLIICPKSFLSLTVVLISWSLMDICKHVHNGYLYSTLLSFKGTPLLQHEETPQENDQILPKKKKKKLIEASKREYVNQCNETNF